MTHRGEGSHTGSGVGRPPEPRFSTRPWFNETSHILSRQSPYVTLAASVGVAEMSTKHGDQRRAIYMSAGQSVLGQQQVLLMCFIKT